MSRKTWGLILLLIGSETLGLLLGEWYFRLFIKTVPPLVMSGFNQEAAHVAFMFYGALTGLVLLAWGLVAALVTRLFRTPDPRG